MPENERTDDTSGGIETGLLNIASDARKSQDGIIRCFSRILSNSQEDLRIRLLAALALTVFFSFLALLIMAILHVILQYLNPEADLLPAWIIFGLLCVLLFSFILFIPFLARASENLEVELEESRMEKIARNKKLVPG